MINFAIATLLATTQPKKPINEWVGRSIVQLEPAPKPLASFQAAEVAEVVIEPAPAPVKPSVETPVSSSGCGDNQYANFIYMHESGCNTGSVNAGGCRGLGQACPGSKLPCGADYACQNAYFTQYANDTYGGWYQAYQFWLGHNWW